MQLCILWCQVVGYANELISVGLRALDELGHPTAAILSISQTDEVRKAYTIVYDCTGGFKLAPANCTDKVLIMYTQ